MHEFSFGCGGGANANGIDFDWDFPGSNLFQFLHQKSPKKLATPKKSWEKHQSAFLDVFCHSEHDGGVKIFEKPLWEPLHNLSSLNVRHCIKSSTLSSL
jgi:hypothetical protein